MNIQEQIQFIRTIQSGNRLSAQIAVGPEAFDDLKKQDEAFDAVVKTLRDTELFKIALTAMVFTP